ncbi:MAG: HpaII family restriction endonuclease [Bacilli bacterium]|nr:HpaII family restriction endonuclease [Bacilli bacterium]
MMLTGNKGEWSEIYVFLKLLSTGKLYAADSELNRIDHVFYEILEIFRKENIGELKFLFDKENQMVRIIKQDDETFLLVLEVSEFSVEADYLLEKIQSEENRTFSIQRIEEFLNRMNCNKLKAPTSDKSDIMIRIHDLNTGYEPVLCFSIKSRLGSPSTLLNAGKTTNFTYKISGPINDSLMNEFNGNKKIRKAFFNLLSAGCRISFVDIDNKTFKNNLVLIDADLPIISSLMLEEYYIHGKSNINEVLLELETKNELNYNLEESHPFYRYKFKKFITETALGMLPSRPWTGRVEATGGYIVVREDGEVLCYHLYNRNEFEDYLLNNTKFDTPSTSRHEFAKIYKENNEYFIKLNMQIRFIR